MTICTLGKQLEVQGLPAGDCWGQNLNLRVYSRHPTVYSKGWGCVPSASMKSASSHHLTCSPTLRSSPLLAHSRAVNVWRINEQTKGQPTAMTRLQPPHKEGSPIQMAHRHKSSTEVTATLLTFPAHSLSLTQHQGVAIEGTPATEGDTPSCYTETRPWASPATSEEIPLQARPIPSGTAPPQAGIRSKRKLYGEYEHCGD